MAPGTLARAGLRFDMIAVFGAVGQGDAAAMCMQSQFGTRRLADVEGQLVSSTHATVQQVLNRPDTYYNDIIMATSLLEA